MTSTRLFPTALQKKIQMAYLILRTINQKESLQIIEVLKAHADIPLPTIAAYLKLPIDKAEGYLKALSKTKVLLIKEREDQAFFSLDYKRLSKISSVTRHLSQ